MRQGLLYAGTETRPLRLVRRRRELAAVPAQPAVHADHGPRGQERRPRRRDAGPRLLDPRRPDGAAPVERRDRRLRRPTSSRRARRCAWTTSKPDEEDGPQAIGANPPPGVVVDYWLKDAPKEGEKVTLEFFDGDTLLRSFSNEKPAPLDDLKEQAARAEEREGQGQAARAEGRRQPLRLGHADPEADARAEDGLQRGHEGPAEGRPRHVYGEADRGGQVLDAARRGPAASGRIRDGGGPQGAARPAQGDPRPAVRDARDDPRDPGRAQPGPTRSAPAPSGSARATRSAKRATAVAAELTAVEDQLTNPAHRGRRGRPQLRAAARPRLGVPRGASSRAPTRSRRRRRSSTTRCSSPASTPRGRSTRESSTRT